VKTLSLEVFPFTIYLTASTVSTIGEVLAFRCTEKDKNDLVKAGSGAV